MSLSYRDDFFAADNELFERGFGTYTPVFMNTNEDLNAFFDGFSVVDKDVLSVVGSGDQYFWSRFKGAKTVDTFDINRLTIHYLYLRKWLIKYCGKFYLNGLGNDTIASVVKKVLSKVQCESETELNSFKFWMSFVENNSSLTIFKFFNICKLYKSSEIKDLDTLSNIISSDDINFYNQDLSGQLIIPNTYDIVIGSNILEHLNVNKDKLIACRDNLYSLLNTNGQAIFSYLLTFPSDPPVDFQKKIFSEKFDFHDIYSSESTFPVGYSYIKR